MSDVKSEIAALVTKKVGIPADKAVQAVDVVLNYLKQKCRPLLLVSWMLSLPAILT